MDIAKVVEMIDSYLAEGNTRADWVECLEICKVAVKRAIPKLVVEKTTQYGDIYIACPTCGKAATNCFITTSKPIHCQVCGQALDWGLSE